MAIIAEQTVGRFRIYEVDAGPDFVSDEGSIAMSTDGGTMWMYVNGTWLSINSHTPETATLVNATSSWDVTGDVLGTYYILANETGWSLSGNGSGDWSLNANYQLTYNGNNTVRVLIKGFHQFTTGTGKWAQNRLLIGKNDTVPTPLIENVISCAVDDVGGAHEVTNKVMQIFDMANGDYISLGRGTLAVEGGGGSGASKNYLVNNVGYFVQVVDTARNIPILLFSEDWESGGFGTGGWTPENGGYIDLTWTGTSGSGNVTINGTPVPTTYDLTINNTALGFTKQVLPAGITAVHLGGNVTRLYYTGAEPTVTYTQLTTNLQVAINSVPLEINAWNVGTATASSGTNSAYISNDAGVSDTYTITTASVSHLYKAITIPSGVTSINIDFDWICAGENGAGDDDFDYGRVFIVNDTTIPVPGTQLPVADSVGLLKYNGQATWTSESISSVVTPGETIIVVFSWTNDGGVGTNPGFGIDNINITGIQF
jgi:hypothetical protein